MKLVSYIADNIGLFTNLFPIRMSRFGNWTGDIVCNHRIHPNFDQTSKKNNIK